MYLHIHTIIYKSHTYDQNAPLPPAKQKDDASTLSCRTKESFHACQACMQALTTPVHYTTRSDSGLGGWMHVR